VLSEVLVDGRGVVDLNVGGPGVVPVGSVLAIVGGPRVDISVGGPGVCQVVTNVGGPRVVLKVEEAGGPGVVGTVGGPGVVTTWGRAMGNALGKRVVRTLGENGLVNGLVIKPKNVDLSEEVDKGVLLVLVVDVVGNALGKRVVRTLGENGLVNGLVIKPKNVVRGCVVGSVCMIVHVFRKNDLSEAVDKGVLLVLVVDGVGNVRRQLS